MTPPLRSALQALVIGSGAVVAIAAIRELRSDDWAVYVAFVVVHAIVYALAVEVLPGLRVPVPDMAATIGFVYVGGLPILLVRVLTDLSSGAVSRLLPESWGRRLGADFARFREPPREALAVAAEWSIFALGLAVRWWVASALADGPPFASPGAIAVGELAGYVAWGALSILPIYPERSLLPLVSGQERLRSAIGDIQLVVILAITPFVFLITYGFRHHGLDGAVAWALSTIGLHFMLRRLNERRLTVEEQNRRLELLNRELEHRERLSAIGKMSSVVSHQILHQLGVIGIYADLIRNAADGDEAKESSERTRENAEAIEAALRDVNRVLTDLLVFSKDLRLNLYEHDLAAVVDESIGACRVEAAERGVSIRRTGGEGLRLRLDKLKIKQALGNVLRNAIEVSPPGSEVVVAAAPDAGGAAISVRDLGPGIPEAVREKVFAPFFTTKERGTGLGLAIAREFTEAHGGTLVVEPADGPGARFVFRLPLDGENAGANLRTG